MLGTNWVVPGQGSTFEELCFVSGKIVPEGKGKVRTSLELTGYPIQEYDMKRIEVMLERIQGKSN